jgi:2-polyprenyl-6-methoxyphenol hydroxylase-like FAD-dependent oxidoreductase
MSLRVLIAGAGLGGLTLAHGLRKVGLQPIVFERGPAELDLSASYRIHIDANGSRALHTCLPPDQWRAFETHSAASPRGIAFTTEHLNELGFIPEPGAAQDGVGRSHPISRAGLRQLLLSGLERTVAFESRVVGYEQSDREVVAHLADGRSVAGDVLVGADGSGSAVRKQLVPLARVVDTGVAGIAGKVYLSERVRDQIDQRLLSQMTMVVPVRGMTVFMAPFVRRQEVPAMASTLDLPEHLFWVVLGRAEAFGIPFGARQHASVDLRDLALRSVEGLHPLVRALIREADPHSLVAVPLHTAESVPAWRTTRVTLLGDAIHTMTPLQGLGGNTALVDSALLCEHLAKVDRGRTQLQSALGRYEARMRRYGFEAVQRSLQVSNAVASTSVIDRLAFRTVLRIADALPWVQHVLFRRPTLSSETVAKLRAA